MKLKKKKENMRYSICLKNLKANECKYKNMKNASPKKDFKETTTKTLSYSWIFSKSAMSTTNQEMCNKNVFTD